MSSIVYMNLNILLVDFGEFVFDFNFVKFLVRCFGISVELVLDMLWVVVFFVM